LAVVFVIEDEIHSEQIGEFNSLETAMAELQRLAAIPWDKPPNVAPCTSWRTCEREYGIVEYDNSATPWSMLRQTPVLGVSAKGVEWFQND
jgi:hypothetical protein